MIDAAVPIGAPSVSMEAIAGLSRQLLALGARAESRTGFLRDATAAILRVTSADIVDLWLEDGDLRYRAQADSRPELAFRFGVLDPVYFRGSTGPQSLFEEVVRFVESGPIQTTPMKISANGSIWHNALEQNVGPAHIAPFAMGTDPEIHCPSLALFRFGIDANNQGVMALRCRAPDSFHEQLVESLETMARFFGVAVANRRSQVALRERVKELTCMYTLAQLAAEPRHNVDEILQQIVDVLPPSLQYPEVATARIEVDGRVFLSRDFVSGHHCLAAPIVWRGAQRGTIEIFYADRQDQCPDLSLLEKDPFLKEERHLIDGVARQLALVLQRKRAEEERETLEQQIRHADRLATIGQLAAGVAHELNEPLGNILGFAQLARKSKDLPAQAGNDLDKIVAASLYAREIIKKLMFFSRQTPGKSSPLDLNQVVDESVSLLNARFTQAGIQVATQLARPSPEVIGDPAQLQQVLVNLFVNAIQAMPGGGRLTVQTSAVNGLVHLCVEDSGVGIPERDLERIFVPFFTTKDVGQGTGLGLAVVHGIIGSHGGSIQVSSTLGQGTRFEISLPAPTDDAMENAIDVR